MTTIRIVRYTTGAEHSDSTERLLRDVYAGLAPRPAGVPD